MPITLDNLRKLVIPYGNAGILSALVAPLNTYLPQYAINTPLRVQHFLAQAAHETDHFKTLHEYASGAAYQGRKDLGNTHPGDGVKYKGRGIFQCTGRSNYEAYGRRLGLDLINRPELAADPEVSVRIACEYWKAKGLNRWADDDDVEEVTRKINGGRNGLAEREALLDKAKELHLGENMPVAPRPTPPLVSPTVPAPPVVVAPVVEVLKPLTPLSPVPPAKPTPPVPTTREEVPDAPISPDPVKKPWESTEVLAAGGGFLSTVLAALQSPWALGGLAVLLAAVFAGWIYYRRMQREATEKPHTA